MIQFQVTFRKSSENIMNTMKSISHNRRLPCQDSNPFPPAYYLVDASPGFLRWCKMLNCLNRKTIRLLDGKKLKPRKHVKKKKLAHSKVYLTNCLV